MLRWNTRVQYQGGIPTRGEYQGGMLRCTNRAECQAGLPGWNTWEELRHVKGEYYAGWNTWVKHWGEQAKERPGAIASTLRRGLNACYVFAFRETNCLVHEIYGWFLRV